MQTNIGSLKKQVEAAEEGLISLHVSDQSISPDKEALPLIEIQEELDEDDNIICKLLTLQTQVRLLIILQQVQ